MGEDRLEMKGSKARNGESEVRPVGGGERVMERVEWDGWSFGTWREAEVASGTDE